MEQTQSVAPRTTSTDVPQEQASKETIDTPTGSSPGPAALQRHALLDSLSGAAFKGAFEHAAIGMALVDLHGRCLAANNALCEMLGYSAEELLEQLFQPITHPDDLPHNLDLGNRLIAGEIPSYRLEKRYFHKRGHIVWVLLSASLVRDPDGKPLYVISQIQDINERKQSEKALRESEARYRSLVNASPDAIASVDLEGHFTYVNHQFAVLIGYGVPEDMFGLRVYEHIAPEDHTVLDADFQRVLQSGTLRNVRYTMVRKDGTRIPTENSYSMIYDTAGKPAALIGVTRDISERLRAEQALRESEERYRRLVETSADAIALTDLNGNYIFGNLQLARLHGYDSVDELIGRDSFTMIAPEDRDRARDNLLKTLSTGYVRHIEYTLLKRDGSRFPIELSASIVRDAHGNPTAFMGIVRDITRRKRAQQALREGEERYRRLVEFSPNFIGVCVGGNIVFINAAGLKLLGAERPEQVLGRSVLDFEHPAEREEVGARISALSRGEVEASRREQVWLRVDGSEVEIELTAIPFMYEGQPAVQAVARDISDRKRAERALRQSEERYRAIVEDQTELVCRFRPDTTLTFVNEAYCRYFGTAREDLIATSFLALMPDEDGQALLAHLAALIASPRTMTYEHEVLIPGGQRRWQEWTNRPILDDHGNIMEFQSVGRDVTDRKRAEAAEREQRILVQALRDTTAALSSTLNFEQVLDRLLANASSVVPHDAANIMLVDSQTNEAYVVRARGYVERGLDEWVRRLRLPLSVASDLRRMIETGQPVVIPDVANAAQWISFPESTWLRAYAAAPIQIKGRTVGFLNFDSATPGFFTTAHVERLQAFADEAAMAIENARLFEATQHSVTRLTLLYHASVALVKAESVDALYREVLHWARQLGEASVATLALFDGKSHVVVVAADGMPQEIVGSRLALGEGLNGRTAKLRAPVQMHRYGDWDGRLLAFNELGIVSAMGLPLIWQDQLVGTLVIAEQHGRKFEDDDMHMLTLFASIVSAALEQRRAMADAQAREAEANALSARLSHAQEEERVRIAGQLHDSIGYRLVASQKNIEAALAALGQGHPLAEHLTANLMILQETHQQARSLAMDLNSKVLADLGISPAARQYIERLSNSTGMSIHLHITGRIRRLPLDVERVAYRGLQETVNNALRHAHATEISAQVHFGSRSLRLTVQDNGCGFDATSLERSTNGKGTSMGLPDLRRQVEASQGTLMLESLPGQGTLVVLTLPIHVAALPDKTKQRVLVVDDHETTRQGVRVTLSQSDDFNCAGEAIDGPSAVHQVELSHPDLVIMDVALPHMNGIEAARQITKRFPHIGIVMLSYQGDETYLDQAFHAGARGYVLKTDDASHIIAALRAVQAGNYYISPALESVWEHLQEKPPTADPIEALTSREREVYQLIIAGNTNRGIGERLGISIRTVEVHRKNIMAKLGVKNLTQLIQFASRNNLHISPGNT